MRSKEYYQVILKDLENELKFKEDLRKFWQRQLSEAMKYERELIGAGKDRRYAWEEMDVANENIRNLTLEIDRLREKIRKINKNIEILEKRAMHLNTEKLRRIKKRAIKRAKQYHLKGWDWKTSMFFAWDDVKKHRTRWEILSFVEVQGDE